MDDEVFVEVFFEEAYMYVILQQGCQQPSVTALQILLNRTIEKNRLKVDGNFGPKTRAAVVDFQRKMHLTPNGIIGMNEWPCLVKEYGLKIVNAVDTSDLETMNKTVIPDLLLAGDNPILAGAMCNGVAHVVSRIKSQIGQSGATVILRFIGHGAPGGQYITGGRWLYLKGEDGKVKKVSDGGAYMNAIYLLKKKENISKVEAYLASLRDIFARFGSVEMHACMIAQETGPQLLKRLASIFGVPVAGGWRTQKVGGDRTFAFEGPVVTAVPFGGDLKGWSRIVAESEAAH